MKKIVSISLLLAFIFAGCANNNENAETPKLVNAIASDATESEITEEIKYEKHIKSVKNLRKRTLRKERDKKTIDLDKFCFKDGRSIHYKANERCKK